MPSPNHDSFSKSSVRVIVILQIVCGCASAVLLASPEPIRRAVGESFSRMLGGCLLASFVISVALTIGRIAEAVGELRKDTSS